jgi:hypothetical protein
MTLRISWGRRFWTFGLSLAECRTFQERIFAAERYLIPVASRAGGRTLIARTAHHMLDRNGTIRIGEIADHAGLSVRQYERRFLDAFREHSMRNVSFPSARGYASRTSLDISIRCIWSVISRSWAATHRAICLIRVATFSRGLFLRYRYWSVDLLTSRLR